MMNYLKAVALVVAATAAGELLHTYTSPPNLMMFYLLAVVLAALKLGIRAAVLTAVAGTLTFDYFFIPARFTFTLLDKEYLPTLLGMLMISLVISRLVATARERADALFEREAETASLYRLSRDLASAADHQSMYAAVVRNTESFIAAQVAIFHAAEQLTVPAAASSGMSFAPAELLTIDMACKSGQRAISPAAADDDAEGLACLPLVQAGCVRGVLALRGSLPGSLSQRLVEGIIAQTASALQRIDLSHQAEQAQIVQTRSNFERALLNSISHDLRTPLVSITYALSTLLEKQDQLPETTRRILLETAYSEANRLNKFVGNLLDMTRIEAGAILLNAEACDLQELIGCALVALEQKLGTRQVSVALPEEQPPLMIDLVLMTQVLVNLLDNALKYSPPESTISISAYREPPWFVLEVADRGPGIPEEELQRVFDKFYRIPVPEGAGGTGLGLSICKGLVEAHGGRIEAKNRPDGGARLLVQLPIRKGEL